MHHDTYQYKTSFLYKLYEGRWTKFVDYIKFRSGVAALIFFGGILLLIAGSLVSMKVLAHNYIFLILILIPPIITSLLSRKELFLQLDANIINNRVYSRGINKWILWAATYFVNLMVVGGASLLLFSIICITLAEDEPEEQTVYVEKVEIDKQTKRITAHIVFEDGLKTLIHNTNNKWEEDSNQSLLVKKSILGIRVLAE